MAETSAYIGLGSNLGDRGKTLLEALKRIDELEGVEVRKTSQFVRTEPVGGPDDQDWYLNAAAELRTRLGPPELLAALQDIERSLGRRREREQRWGPRTCDLDILLMGELVLEADELTVPHPRMHERLFVLRPLASIAAQEVHPVLGKSVLELLLEAEVSQGPPR
ncbi:MAG TPA: 2-amino-4-hydroxy-6-hydroxymethyldihydropteridine diphosphokinase [Phycisphaerae bacterium]|nr:2-amino-4-hydroxy-6-hydroxymethyldihydropteridine diphosphokinase [Phycisphaerae bacterium]